MAGNKNVLLSGGSIQFLPYVYVLRENKIFWFNYLPHIFVGFLESLEPITPLNTLQTQLFEETENLAEYSKFQKNSFVGKILLQTLKHTYKVIAICTPKIVKLLAKARGDLYSSLLHHWNHQLKPY